MLKKVLLFSLIIPFVGCDMADKIERKASVINRYEKTAHVLAKENRALQAEINRLNFKIQSIESERNFMKLKLQEKDKEAGRGVASIQPVKPGNDLVKFGVYKWKPEQLITMAQTNFEKGDYEAAAQYYQSFFKFFPKHELVNDQLIFQAGVAAYESKKNHDWVLASMNKLIEEYPSSKFFRGAKLWKALTHLKLGHEKQFFNTVEEFRKKYRNTPEWKILSAHYEKIVLKYKN